ncbi:MAG TPA: DUF1566 domain-containing protein [Candidatus Scalindua sp.]|jgi:hypothetical protein|nr:DUF1566 domain-containing protein [Candidatus Scalindua sp.]|tara:strand:+ start:1567 stop:2370 length:804 start_codon:yes stop_codon:yes gene_type:complete
MITEKIAKKNTKPESFDILASRHIKSRKGKNRFGSLKDSVSVCTEGEGLITAEDATGPIRLRSSYNELTPSQIHLLPHIRVRERHNNIFLCHSTISHEYKRKKIRKDSVVIDKVTGIMWHRSGSTKYMKFKKARKWIMALNRNGYAGYNDWRLPTLEEAASLLESDSVRDGCFIGKLFSGKQWEIWSGDIDGKKLAWIVTFANGTMRQVRIGSVSSYIRPVRSLDRESRMCMGHSILGTASIFESVSANAVPLLNRCVKFFSGLCGY